MKRDQLMTFVVNENERQEIKRLSHYYQRSMADAIRFAVRKEVTRIEVERQLANGGNHATAT